MSTVERENQVPWILWPFWAVWQLIAWIVNLTGRLLAVILGFILLVAGLIVTLTIVGAIIGLPLMLLGLLLVVRGLL
jgi:hypothetical protein